MNEARLVIDLSSIFPRASGPATGDIALVIGVIVFPMEGWNDFALAVLEAWLTALVRIARRTSDAERVHFMEGPYMVDIVRLSNGAIQVRAIERPNVQRAVIEAIPLALVENAVAAADGVLTSCRQRGHCSTDLDGLERAVAALRQELPNMTS